MKTGFNWWFEPKVQKTLEGGKNRFWVISKNRGDCKEQPHRNIAIFKYLNFVIELNLFLQSCNFLQFVDN